MKRYIQPSMKIRIMEAEQQMLAGSNGNSAHEDETKKPEESLGRHTSVWEDENDYEEDYSAGGYQSPFAE